MPSALPDGEPAPASGELPAVGPRPPRRPPLRDLRPRPVLQRALRLLRLQHLHADRARGDGASVGDLRRRGAAPSSTWPCRCWVRRAPPVSTVFVGGGTPTLLAAARPRAGAGRHPRAVRPGARRRGDHRGQPRLGDARVAAGAGRRRLHPRLRRHAVGGAARARDPRAHPRPGQRADAPSTPPAAAGLQGQRRPDLRHAGGVAATTGAPASTPRSPCEPDHVSAYALVVEEGTKLAAQVRRGEVPAPEDDDEADKYELADEVLAAAGYGWYEVSNWARTDDDRCRHNEGYWPRRTGGASGPGAHSHVGGVRWWNVKHPNAYAARLGAGESPGSAAASCSPTTSATTSGCCSACACVDGLAVDALAAAGALGRGRAHRRRAGATARPGAARPPGGADPAGAAARRHRGAPAPRRLTRWVSARSVSDIGYW